MRLTSTGRLLVNNADELDARWSRMHAALLRDDNRTPETLRLCGFSSGAAALLPQPAKHVRQLHPATEVTIVESDPARCFELLLADAADLALVVTTDASPRLDDRRFEQRSLAADPLDLLVPVNHRFAALDSVPLAATADESWIMDHPGRPNYQLVLTSCLAAGFNPSPVHQISEWETGAALVDAGLGVCLIPRSTRLPARYAIVRVPLEGSPSPARHVRTAIQAGTGNGPLLASALSALQDLAPEAMQ
ncbi:MAG: LysR substrate-binding domain-containing protein [Ornithinimicrobium sp.]